jgi:hypothetical protein
MADVPDLLDVRGRVHRLALAAIAGGGVGFAAAEGAVRLRLGHASYGWFWLFTLVAVAVLVGALVLACLKAYALRSPDAARVPPARARARRGRRVRGDRVGDRAGHRAA